MGIKGLFKLISDNSPAAIKEKEMKSYFGQKVAVDASMSLYQFLIAVRAGPDDQQLTNEAGEVTSHIGGMFYRTIRLMDNGIKPVFVFDGKPPQLKMDTELVKRKERREKLEGELKEAVAAEATEDQHKLNRMLVKVTKEHNEDVKKLLRLMGVPVIEAPSEAEAQCAQMARDGLVFATATEDMDALTFGTTKLLRHFTAPASKKLPIVEIDLKIVLEDLNLTMEQFQSMCILCGCDYTTTVRGVGPVRALELIKKYGTIEEALQHLDKKKYPVPAEFLHAEALKLFVDPEVVKKEDMKEDMKLVWKDPDEEGLIEYLVNQKGFALERIKGGLERIKKARGKSSQKRMESFFGAATLIRKKPDPKLKGKGSKGKGSNKKPAFKKRK
mmetsp:Transcript_13771/g.26701  ORF Transcript_13771/g.26701 Transcript_13771/m.26701 type:complete len:386 (+) Transcript_13771:47-1204(+)